MARNGRMFRVTGQVQGVGYRPWIYRQASRLALTGWVRNDLGGVSITAWGSEEHLAAFGALLLAEGPPMARIHAVRASAPPAECREPAGFTILPSGDEGVGQWPTPDIATCPECLAEVQTPGARRHRYPFTSCSHCGPRASILRALPWDRARTTMDAFTLCPACRAEYEDPADRRYHAQPLACPDCGPALWYEAQDAGPVAAGEAALQAAVALLRAGGILALKGTGGWQLACDAGRADVVAGLRARKRRPHKPFALMARDLASIQPFCVPDPQEEQALTDAAAPIVLMDVKPGFLPEALAPGLRRLGFMLAHSPLHHLLLEDLDGPLVMTSGNIAGEPQIVDDDEARAHLSAIADGFLGHTREIARRMDDSVVQLSGGRLQVIRAGRGLAPLALELPRAPHHGPVLALGGHLKNTFALGQNGQVLVAPHVGDLDSERARGDAVAMASLYRTLLRDPPATVACDLHPDYASTRVARQLGRELDIPVTGIQHHHAHFAACLLEHGIPADAPPVLGVILDGLGYGADGSLWGGEFLLGGYAGSERRGTCKPVALPGGERALREPWRNLLAHLGAELGLPWLRMNFGHLEVSKYLLDPTRAALAGVLGDAALAPPASSCGRLFDAVAAAVGICREQVSYEGQAAMELEACVDAGALGAAGEEAAYPFPAPRLHGNGLPYLEPMGMWQALFGDLHLGTPRGVIAARFHRGLAAGIGRLVLRLRGDAAEPAFRHVVLSGGVFQNRILQQLVREDLEMHGLTVLCAGRLPAGDGGIAAGQTAIAIVRGT